MDDADVEMDAEMRGNMQPMDDEKKQKKDDFLVAAAVAGVVVVLDIDLAVAAMALLS